MATPPTESVAIPFSGATAQRPSDHWSGDIAARHRSMFAAIDTLLEHYDAVVDVHRDGDRARGGRAARMQESCSERSGFKPPS